MNMNKKTLKHAQNGKDGTFYCVIVALLLFGLAALLGCSKEEGNEGVAGSGDNKKDNTQQELQAEENDINRIKQDYFNQLIKPLDASVPFESLEIEKEYGVFDGYIVIRFYPVLMYPAVFIPVEIGGVVIDLRIAERIIAWKDGQAFTLISAQENNILSPESLREIALVRIYENTFTEEEM